MQNPIQSARGDKSGNQTSLGLTTIPLDQGTLPEQARPHHPLVSSRRIQLSGALRAEIQELRHRSQDAEVAKSSILGNLSHEFRTPLNAILGFSELLLSEAAGKMEDERHREYIGDIHASAFRLLAMVNVLLDTADLTQGLTDLTRRDTDLIKIILEAHDVLKSTAQGRNITLELDADCESCWLAIDAERFSHAAQQILSEAISQARSGETILVRIDSGSESVSVSFLCLPNRETLRPVVHEAPEAHFVSHSTEAACGCSIDLDLSIARTIVELHGGTVDVVNDEHGGLQVALLLPRHPGQTATGA